MNKDQISTAGYSLLLCGIFAFSVAGNLYNIYWIDASFVLLFVIGIFQKFVIKNNTSFKTQFGFELSFANILITAFFAASIFGYVFSSGIHERQVGDILEYRWILGYYAFYFLGREFNRNNLDLKFTTLPLLLILSAIFFVHYKSSYFFFSVAHRLQGFYENPNHLALALVIIWAFILGQVLIKSPHRNLANMILNIGVLLLTLVLLVATYSRTSWIGIACVFLASMLLTKNRKALYFSGGILALFTLFLAFKDLGIGDRLLNSLDLRERGSQFYRLVYWNVSWNIFLDHPLFGVGPGQITDYYPQYFLKLGYPSDYMVGHSHNQFLEILAGSGFAGLAAYLGIFGGSLVYFFKWFKKAPHPAVQKIALGALLLVVGLFTTSVTETPARLHEVRNYLLILIGFSIGYLHFESKKPSADRT